MPRNPSESSEVRGMEELVGVKPVVGVTSCSWGLSILKQPCPLCRNNSQTLILLHMCGVDWVNERGQGMHTFFSSLYKYAVNYRWVMTESASSERQTNGMTLLSNFRVKQASFIFF